MNQLFKVEKLYKFLFLIVFFVNQLNTQNCTICLYTIDSKNSINLPCTHTFCTSCLNTYVAANPHTYCPNCRFYIGNQNGYDLFKQFIEACKNKDLKLINFAEQVYSQKISSINNLEFIIKSDFIANLDSIKEQIQRQKQSLPIWLKHLTEKIKLFIDSRYSWFNKKNRRNQLALKRQKLLTDIYLELYNTSHLKKNKSIQALFTKLLTSNLQFITDKRTLLDGIDFFKENKKYLKIITIRYINLRF